MLTTKMRLTTSRRAGWIFRLFSTARCTRRPPSSSPDQNQNTWYIEYILIYWTIKKVFWGMHKVFFFKTRIPLLIFWSSVISQLIFLSHLTRWLTVRLLKIQKILFRSQWIEGGVKRICCFLKSHLPSVWPSRQSPDARHYHWKTLRGVSPSHK